MLNAPWSEEQVLLLNKYQNEGLFHPYTCGNCREILIATKDGWICNKCDYKQNWCLGSTIERKIYD